MTAFRGGLADVRRRRLRQTRSPAHEVADTLEPRSVGGRNRLNDPI